MSYDLDRDELVDAVDRRDYDFLWSAYQDVVNRCNECQFNKEKGKKMRERLFKEMLFCGTPEVYFMGLGKLHAQLSRALLFISGLQQPPHSTSEEEAREDEYDREQGWKEVMVCVQDIVCALLGPDYYIEKKIPESECCQMEHKPFSHCPPGR